MYDVALISSCPLKYFPWFLARLEGLVKAILLTLWSPWSVRSFPCHHHAHFRQPSDLSRMRSCTVPLDFGLNWKPSPTSFHRLHLRISANSRSWDNRIFVAHDDDEHLQQQAANTINEGNTDRPWPPQNESQRAFQSPPPPPPAKTRVVALSRHHNYPPLSKTSNTLVFEGGCYLPRCHRPRKRAYSLVFIGGWLLYAAITTTLRPTLKMSNALVFEGVYSVPPPPPLSYLENEHPHSFSTVLIFFMYIYNSLMYIIIINLITYI